MLEKSEEGQETAEEPQQKSSMRYRIFQAEQEGEEITLLNFSDSYGRREPLPDYTADKLETTDEEEIWRVNTEENTVEAVFIESDYRTRHELASRLQQEYDSAVEDYSVE